VSSGWKIRFVKLHKFLGELRPKNVAIMTDYLCYYCSTIAILQLIEFIYRWQYSIACFVVIKINKVVLNFDWLCVILL
jgi:hypothetical protein